MMNVTPVVKQLLIMNIIFFIGSQFVPATYELFALHYTESNQFRFWQPLTHMFMHARLPDIYHILFNMFALYSFGSNLEYIWGGKKFLFFYISCGLGAALIQLIAYYFQLNHILESISGLNLTDVELKTILNADISTIFDSNGQLIPSIKNILERAHCTQDQFNRIVEAKNIYNSNMVGASGAIYGLLAAFAFLFPNAVLSLMFIPVPIKAKYFVPIFMLIYDGFFGIFGFSFFNVGSGVAHFAHIGGALTGFIMVLIWKKNQFNDKRWN